MSSKTRKHIEQDPLRYMPKLRAYRARKAAEAEQSKLTAADIEAMYANDNWLGFGYLGERRNMLITTDSEAAPEAERRLLVEAVDQRLLDHANAEGWTDDDLFAWANSKNGRWFADTMFGRATERIDQDFDEALRHNLLTVEK
jgi:hypothetical protein